MVKITSKSWVEKDDPMFTGRFHIHSVRAKESVQKRNKKDKIKSYKLKDCNGNIKND
tara:strand:+ start:143 stop:313 length:171 start_codon:yes stop_codon:yes gene_type:complete